MHADQPTDRAARQGRSAPKHRGNATDLIPPWTEAMSTAACQEGWDIISAGGVDGCDWQIQHLDVAADEAPDAIQLASDEEAWRKVIYGELPVHRAAAAFLQQHNPREFVRIRARVATPEGGEDPLMQMELRFRENGDANSYALIDDKLGRWVLSLLHNGEAGVERQRHVMHRLMASWNYCRGVPLEALLEQHSPVADEQVEQPRSRT